MIIARLLTPAELGIFSVTMVLLMFVSTIRDMGASQYMVQETELTVDRIRAAWAVQVGLGIAMAALVALASHPVAVFYQEPRIQNIMLVIAFSYLVNPLGSLTNSWLQREMRFESIAVMRFAATLSGAIVACVMASKDFGPISLAFGAVTSTLVNALIGVYLRPKALPWMPGIKELKRVLTFGSKLTGSFIVIEFAEKIPELFLGKLQNLTAAGLFSRANGLVEMFDRLFVDAVWSVCLPWFSRERREGAGIATPFMDSTSYVTAFGWSFCLVVFFLAQPIIRFLYGVQWDAAVDLTRLLAVAMAFKVPVALCRVALLSSGNVGTIGRVTTISALQTMLFVATGTALGLLQMGCFVILASAISTYLWLKATAKHLEIPLARILNSLRKSVGVALLAAIGPAVSFAIYGPYPQVILMPLSVGVLGSLAGFVLGLFVFRHALLGEFAQVWAKVTSKSL